MKTNEEKHYESQLQWTESRFSNEHELKRFMVTEQVIPDDVISLLDIGCGNGAFLEHLEKYRINLKLQGIERSNTALESAVCKAPIFEGSVDSLSFDNGSFDIVSALEVIEHLPFTVYEAALKELERISKEYILISVPYRENRVKALCPYCKCEFNPDYHLRIFSEEDLDDLFDEFKPISKEIVYIKDYWLLSEIRRLKWKFSKRWRSDFLCPQCGFNSNDDSQIIASNKASATASEGSLKALGKKIIPNKNVPFWIVALYQNKNIQHPS